jgi:hypothetical protein
MTKTEKIALTESCSQANDLDLCLRHVGHVMSKQKDQATISKAELDKRKIYDVFLQDSHKSHVVITESAQ